MREFNLLPWRSELREKRKRDYIILIAICAGTGLLMVAFIHWIYFLKLQNQNDKNNYLTKQIKVLDKQIVEIKELEKKREKFSKISSKENPFEKLLSLNLK